MTNGYFIDLKNFSINTEGKGRPISVAAIFLLIPILGALFLMFLPVIGFYLLGEMIVVRTKEFVLSHSIGNTAVGAAYLTGRDAGVEEKLNNTTDDNLRELEKEISDLRK